MFIPDIFFKSSIFYFQAFAEELHERVRKEIWGYSREELLEANDLHKIKYQVDKRIIFYTPAANI